MLNDEQMEALIRIGKRRGYTFSELEYWAKHLSSGTDEACDIYLATFDVIYFIRKYCNIYDSVSNSWIPYDLWPIQEKMVDMMKHSKKSVHLKVRQTGATWGALCVAAHEIWTRPLSRVLITSLRDDEAIELLSKDRLRGILSRLPDIIKATIKMEEGNLHKIPFGNGAVIHGLNPNKGDSFTSTLAIIDEADLIDNLEDLVNRQLSPTIEAGGRLIMLSRSDKSEPQSEFKRVYRRAKSGEAPDWDHFFIGRKDHPRYTDEWYERKKKEIFAIHGNYDVLWEQYPESDEEALAPNTADKRIIHAHLEKCLEEMDGFGIPEGMDVPTGLYDLKIFKMPEEGKEYYIGVDTAEGLPTSDNSAIFVIDHLGEEVANCVGKHSPEIQAPMVISISDFYRGASVMVENNYHGYTCITEILNAGRDDILLANYDDAKLGWTSTRGGNIILYDRLAEAIHNHEAKIHDYDAYLEIQSITKSKLEAPEGMADDRADAYALAHAARIYGGTLGEIFMAGV